MKQLDCYKGLANARKDETLDEKAFKLHDGSRKKVPGRQPWLSMWWRGGHGGSQFITDQWSRNLIDLETFMSRFKNVLVLV